MATQTIVLASHPGQEFTTIELWSADALTFVQSAQSQEVSWQSGLYISVFTDAPDGNYRVLHYNSEGELIWSSCVVLTLTTDTFQAYDGAFAGVNLFPSVAPANWIDANSLKDDSITKIQNGLATAANLALIPVDGTLTVTLANGVTHGGSSAMLQLGSSTTTPAFYVTNSSGDNNAHAVYFKAGSASTGGAGLLVDGGSLQSMFIFPATQGLYAGGDSIAHENGITAIKAKTDNLPSDPADASDIASAFVTINTKLDTIDDFLDTEVVAIKAKTDNLPSDPADASDIASSFSSIASTLTIIQSNIDNLPTNAELSTALSAADDAVLAAISTLQTSINTVDDFLDTEITAIKAKTDNLPSDPADQSAVEAAITTATSSLATAANLATIAGYVDTEVAAIKTKTDQMVFGETNSLNVNVIHYNGTLQSNGDLPQKLDSIQSSVNTIDSFIDTEITAILADTNELQTDWANGGRLDNILDARASQISIDDIPTNSELTAALAAADDAVLAAISALNNLSAAQVNTELLDVLNVDTFGELLAPPAASSSLKDKLTWLFMWARNKATQTATERKLYADDGTTVVSTELVGDASGIFTKSEAS